MANGKTAPQAAVAAVEKAGASVAKAADRVAEGAIKAAESVAKKAGQTVEKVYPELVKERFAQGLSMLVCAVGAFVAMLGFAALAIVLGCYGIGVDSDIHIGRLVVFIGSLLGVLVSFGIGISHTSFALPDLLYPEAVVLTRLTDRLLGKVCSY